MRYTLRRLPPGPQRTRLEGTQQRLAQVFQSAMPSGQFIAVAGLPRPDWMGDRSGALSVDEMFTVLCRKQSSP